MSLWCPTSTFAGRKLVTMRALFAFIVLVSSAYAALSQAQMRSVFGDTSNLKGGSFEMPLSFNLTILADDKNALVVMQVPDSALGKASDLGWIGKLQTKLIEKLS